MPPVSNRPGTGSAVRTAVRPTAARPVAGALRPTRRKRRKPEYAVAWAALTLLSAVTAVAFSPSDQDGPISSAQRVAQQAAAQRYLAARQAAVPDAAANAVVPLLSGEQQVGHTGTATRVRVPAVGIDAEVRSVGFVLQKGELAYDVPRFEAGQYVGTANPGQKGNMVISGHVANRGALAVFTRLPEVKLGDTVEVFSGAEVFRYSITELRVVAPDATAVMNQTQDATLTLITCSPDLERRNRWVVVGKLI